MHTTTTKGASEMTDGDQVTTTRKRFERARREVRVAQAQLDREPSGAEAVERYRRAQAEFRAAQDAYADARHPKA